MRRAFTLLELMVASLLLAMLTTILTMIFNQSSIAWTTGVATVAGMGDARQDIAGYLHRADNTLEAANGAHKGLRVVSIWEPGNATDPLRGSGRTVDKGGVTDFKVEDRQGQLPGNAITIGTSGGEDDGNNDGAQGGSGIDSYVVGVASNGPDGIEETWDDISTFPEDQL